MKRAIVRHFSRALHIQTKTEELRAPLQTGKPSRSCKTSPQASHIQTLARVASKACSLTIYVVPHLWRMELHNTGHVFLSTETPFEATEVFQGSLSLRTHGHLSHCPGANFCCCPLSLNLVSRYNIPVFSKESQGPTAVY